MIIAEHKSDPPTHTPDHIQFFLLCSHFEWHFFIIFFIWPDQTSIWPNRTCYWVSRKMEEFIYLIWYPRPLYIYLKKPHWSCKPLLTTTISTAAHPLSDRLVMRCGSHLAWSGPPCSVLTMRSIKVMNITEYFQILSLWRQYYGMINDLSEDPIPRRNVLKTRLRILHFEG